MGASETTLTLNEPFDLKGKRGRVTEGDLASVEAIRDVLILLARSGGTTSYGEVRSAAGVRQPPSGLGRLLDLIGIDCGRRNEPDLAALVVRAESGEVGSRYGADAERERESIYRYWISA